MNVPHKHAEVIHAYADGAQVEYRHLDTHPWLPVECPAFDVRMQYRVKPEPARYIVAVMLHPETRVPFPLLCRDVNEALEARSNRLFVRFDGDWHVL